MVMCIVHAPQVHVFTAHQVHSASVLPSLLTRLFHGEQAAELHTALCRSMALQVCAELPNAKFTVSKVRRIRESENITTSKGRDLL